MGQDVDMDNLILGMVGYNIVRTAPVGLLCFVLAFHD